ncbi:MAG: HlyD family secretion protein [Prevotella sp.]
MNEKEQNRSILFGVIAFTLVVIAVGLIGYFTIGTAKEEIQGEIEVEEYRVSSKVPGRILEICVQEGDFVHAGDTLAILDCPEVEAKKMQASGAEDAAAAMAEMAQKGARQEQIRGAYEVWQQATAAAEVAKKSYERVQRLFDEGVVTAQKRDELYATYKAMEAQEKAAKSQYDMARNGARQEEKRAANAQVERARGAMQEVKAYLHETVQTAQMDGEVSEIFPKVGELVGTGAPIMTISLMKNVYAIFNVKEDMLNGMRTGDTFTAFCPAFNKDLTLRVYNIKDQGSYAAWKATKTNGQYDLKTFEVKARPVKPFDGLRPGMTLVKK